MYMHEDENIKFSMEFGDSESPNLFMRTLRSSQLALRPRCAISLSIETLFRYFECIWVQEDDGRRSDYKTGSEYSLKHRRRKQLRTAATAIAPAVGLTLRRTNHSSIESILRQGSCQCAENTPPTGIFNHLNTVY